MVPLTETQRDFEVYNLEQVSKIINRALKVDGSLNPS